MKVFGVLLLTISFAAIAFAEPVCEATDFDTLWPDYVDNNVYYECIGLRRHVKLVCQSDEWFNFVAQMCVPKADWIAPPPTPTKPQTAPTNHPTAATPARTVATAPTVGPTVPSYPSTEANHPTPPTIPPTAAPTPSPTNAPTPEPTIPVAPPTESTRKQPKRPTKKA